MEHMKISSLDERKEEKETWCELTVEVAETFDLENAVCSHGLFMMAPNHWDPLSKTFQRPLRLSTSHNDDSNSLSASLLVRISQPQTQAEAHFLSLCVFGTQSISPHHRQVLLAQVSRMLRLSEYEERNVREYQSLRLGEAEKRSFGRVFRSPTLFEDMVKCMLLCNCQWPRSLSMARSLCELQLELSRQGGKLSAAVGHNTNLKSPIAENELLIPKTPARKESKRKLGVPGISTNVASKFADTMSEFETNVNLRLNDAQTTKSSSAKDESHGYLNHCHNIDGIYKADSSSFPDSRILEGKELSLFDSIGNFPSPEELANLDEGFLAKRCGLGYRASRIVKLARSVVGGRIQLRRLEEVSGGTSSPTYNELAEQLKEIDGFGPFTCANVLMCMGFYHVIPTDSETIRHLKQVHARKSTIQTVQRDVEEIYGKYAPFQFLAYWSEVWDFYEKRFGRLSEMPPSEYKLITASNMRVKQGGTNKRTKM